MDRPARVKIAQERDWVTPQSPLWFCFEAAVYKLLVEWDVMKMAVEGAWSDSDPLYSRTKIVDDALANFAARAQTGGVDPEDLTEFLVDTMEDRFNAEIENNMCNSLAQVICRIFEESRNGTTTGLRHILGEPAFEAAGTEKQPLALLTVPVLPQSAPPAAPAPAPGTGAQASDEQQQQQQQQGEGATQAAEEDDGWTTIPTRRSNRVRNSYTVQNTLVQQQQQPSAAEDNDNDADMQE
mmetsp:Transcript_14451/g.27960  ORF Transcript_14451/g.27960 Transcript_14451/m.27960 type:complete len:239 (+) Transcript_14451:39-755(+)|eukprot:CAMPEP_0171530186 /NCGR_PEP_ID=MMETSP0959-20130129/12880_1 /TAXON_ID=87120 /ORGANISM="Aurantiochytrium limacinum, Strain ATCCMYA-1381" /LENGTH=238 /DNA_ID=CAMNT_0012072835 /DNA_START=28 /DNA_END=744 /DNA_ORIENTATION=+